MSNQLEPSVLVDRHLRVCYETAELMFKFFHSSNSSTSGSAASTSSPGGSGSGSGDSNINMGSLRDLQQALQQKDSEIKMRDSRISVLEQELKKKDETIRNLNRELDKYRSVLQPTTTSTSSTIKTRQRLQGISAEPQSLTKSQALNAAPLKRHSKSSK